MTFASNTTRRTIARSTGVLVAVAAAMVSACSGDSVTQPDLTARNGLLSATTNLISGLIPVTALMRDTAVATAYTRSFTFTTKGGRIEMPELGMRVDVPEGAIPGDSLTIVVTALPGKAIAYDFQPHGTVFLKPLAFRQDLNNTSWDKLGFKGIVNGGYFKDAAQIDLLKGSALLDELFPVTIKSSRVSFDIKHFSGYMVSGGRQAPTSASEF